MQTGLCLEEKRWGECKVNKQEERRKKERKRRPWTSLRHEPGTWDSRAHQPSTTPLQRDRYIERDYRQYSTIGKVQEKGSLSSFDKSSSSGFP